MRHFPGEKTPVSFKEGIADSCLRSEICISLLSSTLYLIDWEYSIILMRIYASCLHESSEESLFKDESLRENFGEEASKAGEVAARELGTGPDA